MPQRPHSTGEGREWKEVDLLAQEICGHEVGFQTRQFPGLLKAPDKPDNVADLGEEHFRTSEVQSACDSFG